MYNVQRYFDITVQKNQSDTNNVTFLVTSSFPVTETDFQDTAYIVANNNSLLLNLDFNNDNIYYKENINTIQTRTTSETRSKKQNEDVKPVYAANPNYKEKTDTKTTSSTTIKTDTRINSVILDIVISKRVTRINTYKLKDLLSCGQIHLRLYGKDGDYRDITFSPEENIKIRKVKNSVYDAKVK